jgi:hypothetical protein
MGISNLLNLLTCPHEHNYYRNTLKIICTPTVCPIRAQQVPKLRIDMRSDPAKSAHFVSNPRISKFRSAPPKTEAPTKVSLLDLRCYPKCSAFKQTTQKFHRIFGKPLSIIGFCQFRPSQFSAHSKAGFLGDAASPMESTIRSSEKSNSPCKLKCCQVTAEPWRMASISSARRFSFFSAATSRER